MMIYKRRVSHSIGKWFLALIIFVAAMTITWNDVEGASLDADTLQSVIQK